MFLATPVRAGDLALAPWEFEMKSDDRDELLPLEELRLDELPKGSTAAPS
jgi:hypothetical protein